MGWGNLISLIVFVLAVIAVIVGLVIESAPLAVMGFVIGGIVAAVFGLAVGGDWLRGASGGRFDRPDR
jgi:uncharacterized membrane protein YraQ (UPF0718 family)